MANDDATLSWEQAVQTLRDDPAAALAVRHCYYDDPLAEAAERFRQSTEWVAIRAVLPSPPGDALDVGAGRGIAAYAFARDGWTATALEPDPSAIVGAGAIRALSADTGTPIAVIEEWGERLPFADASFDVVHCRAVLHHARDLGQLCAEVARVLRPGGTFIATREHVVTRKEDIPAFQRNHLLHRLYGGEYAYRLDEYKGAITRAGLTLRHVLNPMQSDINLFPTSRREIKQRWARRLRLPPLAGLLPDALLTLRGRLFGMPGRLYTFVSVKPAA